MSGKFYGEKYRWGLRVVIGYYECNQTSPLWWGDIWAKINVIMKANKWIFQGRLVKAKGKAIA